jgi:N-methylhydantoinase B/oxoprolinase/acetone carboxylase alpha subunit
MALSIALSLQEAKISKGVLRYIQILSNTGLWNNPDIPADSAALHCFY